MVFEFQLFKEDQQLTSLIWMSLDQILYYTRFYKILIFDYTVRINYLDMILYLFFIIDNNIKFQLVISAIIKR